MKVLLAGASGVIGTGLVRELGEHGHEVVQLVRREPSGPAQVRWAPERGELDPAVFSGVDAVVCLSGAGVGDRRWTDAYRTTLRESRLQPVGTLARALSEPGRPRTLICASAVGYYGDGGDRILDESAPSGEGFLAELCRLWEGACDPARQAGVRVVTLRTGLVLAPQGGLLGRLGPILKLGGGGKLGSGQQYWPWITLADELGAIRFLLEGDLSGPVNVTGPEPVRSIDAIRALAYQLRRPAVLPTPAFALRLALGDFADEGVLAGQRAIPRALLAAGYQYQHDTMRAAAEWVYPR